MKVSAMSHEKAVAYGEIGLDYHVWPASYNYAKADLQKEIFISQIKHALELKKPIIIHTREAEEDTLEIMKQYIPHDWKVGFLSVKTFALTFCKIHVHCFTDSLQFCLRLVEEWPNVSKLQIKSFLHVVICRVHGSYYIQKFKSLTKCGKGATS